MNTNVCRILSIDPGCSHMGTAILDLFLDGSIMVQYAETIHTDKLIKYLKDVNYTHGGRYAKLIAINTQLKNVLTLYQPNVIVSENAFINPKRPVAFGALVEAISMVRTTVYQHNPSIPLETIDPSSIKKAVGVSGISGDKGLMQAAMLKCNLLYEPYLNPHLFDEHTVDACCIGYAFCERLKLL